MSSRDFGDPDARLPAVVGDESMAVAAEDSFEQRVGGLVERLEKDGETEYAQAWRFAMSVPPRERLRARVLDTNGWEAGVVDPGDGRMRPSELSGQLLFAVSVLQEDAGASQDDLMGVLGLSRLQQGRLSLSLKDGMKLGLLKLTVPRTEQYRYALTDKGWTVVGRFQIELEADAEDEAWQPQLTT